MQAWNYYSEYNFAKFLGEPRPFLNSMSPLRRYALQGAFLFERGGISLDTKIICHICRQPLPIMDRKLNRKSIILSVGFCGHCETMARSLMQSLRKLIEQKRKGENDG